MKTGEYQSSRFHSTALLTGLCLGPNCGLNCRRNSFSIDFLTLSFNFKKLKGEIFLLVFYGYRCLFFLK